MKITTKKDLKKEFKEVEVEVKKHIITAVVAALGFMIALFWRDAIQSMLDEILIMLNLTQKVFYYKIIAAIIVTLICVFAIVVVAKFGEKEIKP